MNILVTGGGGFIGSNLTALLLDKNHSVTVIDNFITGRKRNLEALASNKNITIIEADITAYDFPYTEPFDIIYHLASPASPIQYQKYSVETLMVNSLGTKNVLDFMIRSESKRFVISSTSEVYGDPLVHPQPESYWGNVNPNGERACYDEAKRFSEALTMTYRRKYNTDVRIARIFNTYGPNMEKNDGRVISNFIVQSLTNKPMTIYGDGRQTRSFCYVDDLVNALYIFGTLDNLAGEVINLGNPVEKSVREIARIIKKMTKSKSEITYTSIGNDDPKRRRPDISKAKNLLQWDPHVSLESGLQKTVDYFKSVL